MASEVQLAVAGSGKTSAIASRIESQPPGATSLAVTFTTNGQAEIVSRLSNVGRARHETMGWYAFLVNHIVRPYLPAKFKGIDARGLNFVDHDGQIPRNRSGWRYYFDDGHQPYSSRLGVLAKQILEVTHNAPMRRLEAIYSHLYIDEVQDLGGNDLIILEKIMGSSIDVFVTGDVRQAVLTTSKSDRLNVSYRGANLVNWFRIKAVAGVCELTLAETSQRFNHTIARLSDLVHDPALALPPTSGAFPKTSDHDGVFLVDDTHLDAYVRAWRPTILRAKVSPRAIPEAEIFNFGASKGITRDRVAILTTVPIQKWLLSRELLADKSAAGFYVAATRGRYSVALVTPRAKRIKSRLHADFDAIVQLWEPSD
jgi:DNA helicase-2/ATP-dependent DNA helicase PcrA